VPRWLVPAALAVIIIISGAVALGMWRYRASLRTVPDVSGLPLAVARDSLALSGLAMAEGRRQFSVDIPEGTVISQDPTAGTSVRRETVVTVVVSAGSESFAMPDVIGRDLEGATSLLSQRGLSVVVDKRTSTSPEGTVLESFPAPGADVRTGDAVRLTVAGKSLDASILLPYDLQGLIFGIDPAPGPTDDATDLALDVARRLQALLEASGARVVLTRSAVSSATASAERVQALGTVQSAANVGLVVALQEPPGVLILAASSREATVASAASELAATMTTAARLPGLSVLPPGTRADDVLSALSAPGVRVSLGALEDPADASRFADPAWADTIARSLYRALGVTYGEE